MTNDILVSVRDEVLRLCEAVRRAGGRAMLVGGGVRDRLLGKESKDHDIEVYGLEPDRLRTLLGEIGRVSTVGEQFAVYKLLPKGRQNQQAEDSERLEIDVSIPRRESKSGRGHRAFTIEGDPRMSFPEAARRRDFTINAILYDPLTDEFVDPYGGVRDLHEKRLRAVAADTFVEDSLRVLRAVQLAARFEMTIDEETVALCRTIDLADLPHERVWGEIEKLLLMAARPSIGLQAALDLGVLEKLFPEVAALAGCPPLYQSLPGEKPSTGESGGPSDRHPAGQTVDAFTHTKAALDKAVGLSTDLARPQRLMVMLATLCHALGSPASGAADGQETVAGEGPESAVHAAEHVMDRLGLYTIAGQDVRGQVAALVRDCGTPGRFYAQREHTTDGDIRRLARRVRIDLLYRVSKACGLAAVSVLPPLALRLEAADWIIARSRELGVEQGPPAPLLLGRHLVEMGVAPGPAMGEVLRQVYELQLDGKVSTLDEARAVSRRMAAVS